MELATLKESSPLGPVLEREGSLSDDSSRPRWLVDSRHSPGNALTDDRPLLPNVRPPTDTHPPSETLGFLAQQGCQRHQRQKELGATCIEEHPLFRPSREIWYTDREAAHHPYNALSTPPRTEASLLDPTIQPRLSLKNHDRPSFRLDHGDLGGCFDQPKSLSSSQASTASEVGGTYNIIDADLLTVTAPASQARNRFNNNQRSQATNSAPEEEANITSDQRVHASGLRKPHSFKIEGFLHPNLSPARLGSVVLPASSPRLQAPGLPCQSEVTAQCQGSAALSPPLTPAEDAQQQGLAGDFTSNSAWQKFVNDHLSKSQLHKSHPQEEVVSVAPSPPVSSSASTFSDETGLSTRKMTDRRINQNTPVVPVGGVGGEAGLHGNAVHRDGSGSTATMAAQASQSPKAGLVPKTPMPAMTSFSQLLQRGTLSHSTPKHTCRYGNVSAASATGGPQGFSPLTDNISQIQPTQARARNGTSLGAEFSTGMGMGAGMELDQQAFGRQQTISTPSRIGNGLGGTGLYVGSMDAVADISFSSSSQGMPALGLALSTSSTSSASSFGGHTAASNKLTSHALCSPTTKTTNQYVLYPNAFAPSTSAAVGATHEQSEGVSKVGSRQVLGLEPLSLSQQHLSGGGQQLVMPQNWFIGVGDNHRNSGFANQSTPPTPFLSQVSKPSFGPSSHVGLRTYLGDPGGTTRNTFGDLPAFRQSGSFDVFASNNKSRMSPNVNRPTSQSAHGSSNPTGTFLDDGVDKVSKSSMLMHTDKNGNKVSSGLGNSFHNCNLSRGTPGSDVPDNDMVNVNLGGGNLDGINRTEANVGGSNVGESNGGGGNKPNENRNARAQNDSRNQQQTGQQKVGMTTVRQQPQQSGGGRHPHPNQVLTDDSFAYCFYRGNGEYTRLIPADQLPPLRDVPGREADASRMVELAIPVGLAPNGRSTNSEPVALEALPTPIPPHSNDPIQNQIDSIVATAPNQLSQPRRAKIYCDKWVHEGVCAFTQQGCKYKHEMPFDKATQHSLGLFHGLPAWWRKHQAELARLQRADLDDSANLPLSLPPADDAGSGSEYGGLGRGRGRTFAISSEEPQAPLPQLPQQTRGAGGLGYFRRGGGGSFGGTRPAQTLMSWRRTTQNAQHAVAQFSTGSTTLSSTNFGPIAPPASSSPFASRQPGRADGVFSRVGGSGWGRASASGGFAHTNPYASLGGGGNDGDDENDGSNDKGDGQVTTESGGGRARLQRDAPLH